MVFIPAAWNSSQPRLPSAFPGSVSFRLPPQPSLNESVRMDFSLKRRFPSVPFLFRRALLAILTATAACTDGPVEPPRTYSLRLVSGGGVTDTIDASLPEPLIVEVRDSEGRPSKNITVDFASTKGIENPRGVYLKHYSHLSFATVNGGPWEPASIRATDAQGRISVWIRYNYRPVAGGVVLNIRGMPSDTVPFTILPGNAIALEALPKDTSVTVGTTFTIQTRVTDRSGNTRSDSIGYRILSGPVAAEGERVTAQGVGRGLIAVEAQGLADTVAVTAVPGGAVAALHHANSAEIVLAGPR
jgi:hypothetical protein